MWLKIRMILPKLKKLTVLQLTNVFLNVPMIVSTSQVKCSKAFLYLQNKSHIFPSSPHHTLCAPSVDLGKHTFHLALYWRTGTLPTAWCRNWAPARQEDHGLSTKRDKEIYHMVPAGVQIHWNLKYCIIKLKTIIYHTAYCRHHCCLCDTLYFWCHHADELHFQYYGKNYNLCFFQAL